MEAPAPDDVRTALTGHVLCIEDEASSMELVGAIVAGFPHVQLTKAYSGRDGVELATRLLPDLVLLDMHLPDISGLEVVRALSQVISERKLRIVLLTGESFSMDVVKAMSLGAQEYWPKPLVIERAVRGLARYLTRSPS